MCFRGLPGSRRTRTSGAHVQAARKLQRRPCGEEAKPHVAPTGLAVCILPNTRMAPGPKREPPGHTQLASSSRRGDNNK